MIARAGRIVWLLLAVSLLACGTNPEAVADADGSPRCILLDGVTVVDGTGADPVPDSSLGWCGDRIVSVGDRGRESLPARVKVVSLEGRTVIPGLIDMHAHVTFLRDPGRPDDSYDREVSEKVLETLLRFGITTVRNPAAPTEHGVRLREDVRAGKIPGPRIFTAGRSMGWAGARTEEAVREEIRRQAAAGVDFIKVYAATPPELVTAAVDEAHTHGVRVIGHLQRTSWTRAARDDIDAITHGASWSPDELPEHHREAYVDRARETGLRARMDWLEWVEPDGPEIETMIDLLVEHRIAVDPTLVAYESKFRGDLDRYRRPPEACFAPEPMLETWKAGGYTADWDDADYRRGNGVWPKMLALVRRYHERGVLLTTGSDLPNRGVVPGVSLHQELERLTEAGIPPLEVITLATRNGAEALGIADEVGTLEPGRLADMVVLGGDPTVDIRHTRSIEAVWQGGRRVAGRLLSCAPDP